MKIVHKDSMFIDIVSRSNPSGAVILKPYLINIHVYSSNVTFLCLFSDKIHFKDIALDNLKNVKIVSDSHIV